MSTGQISTIEIISILAGVNVALSGIYPNSHFNILLCKCNYLFVANGKLILVKTFHFSAYISRVYN
jgi:hypothetical protein